MIQFTVGAETGDVIQSTRPSCMTEKNRAGRDAKNVTFSSKRSEQRH